MLTSIRTGLFRRLTYANVASTLALVIALGGGTAYAANTVFSTDIVDGQVKTVDLGKGAVTTPKLRAGAVTSTEVLDGTLSSTDLADNTVSSFDVSDGTLMSADIASQAIAQNNLRLGSVGRDQLANNSVTLGKVASNAIRGNNILDASLTGADFLPFSVGFQQLAPNGVSSITVADKSLHPVDLAGGDASASVSLATGAIGANSCVSLSVAVPGAAPGQPVLVSPTTVVPSWIVVVGDRSATDSVFFKVCNFSIFPSVEISNLGIRVLTFG